LNLEKDIIGLTDFRSNLTEIIEEIVTEHTEKVIIRNGKPTVVVISVSDYQALQDRLLAAELEAGLQAALEEEKRGELIELDAMIRELGFSPTEFNSSPIPENYEQMIPRNHKRVR
jgi:prevent-host-death family protein